jgi:uncharacterized protein (TIGR02246 family)
MATPTTHPITRPGTAAEVLAAAGIEEDPKYYASFSSDAERAVLAVPQLIQGAWKSNDPDAFASVFTEDGSLLMGDRQLTSRAEIREFMAEGFERGFAGAWVRGWPLELKFLTDDVAVVVTQGGIIFAGESDYAPEREIRATWVIVHRDGAWRLLSHQSSPIRG